MTATRAYRFASTALAALLALALAGCASSTSLGDNDGGGDAAGGDSSVHGDACAGPVPCPSFVRWDMAACACVPVTCAYRDPLPCHDDSVCAVNGGRCDTGLGYCVCPDAGTTTSDACAGPVPCPSFDHWDMAACACVPNADAGPTSCGTMLTCSPSQVCVRHLTEGGALEPLNDDGTCPEGRIPQPCGAGSTCCDSVSYSCETEPAACGGADPTCDCAGATLCSGAGTSCMGASGREVDCVFAAP